MRPKIKTKLRDSSGNTSFGMDDNIATFPWEIGECEGVCISAIWSDGSSPAGDLGLQVSNDNSEKEGDVASTSWSDVTNSSYTISGNSGIYTWDFETFARWIRVIYTRSSGDGTIVFEATGKGI